MILENRVPPTKTASKWVVYEKSGTVCIGEQVSFSNKNIRLCTGEKIPHHRLWLVDIPEITPAIKEQILHYRQHLSIEQCWQAAAGRQQTLESLGALLNKTSIKKETAFLIALLELILSHPAYFRRHGHFLTPVPTDLLEKVKASLQSREEDKKLEASTLAQLQSGFIPTAIEEQKMQLLIEPNKASPIYRALRQHTGGKQNDLIHFFIKAGLFKDALDYWHCLFQQTWEPLKKIEGDDNFPAKIDSNPCFAFSIDDAGTLEIDDAFSVSEKSEGIWRIGVHIAIPSLSIDYRSLSLSENRLTSVYFPDKKHFMLSSKLIEAYSFQQQAIRPALSLYLLFNAHQQQWEIEETKLDSIFLESSFTPEDSPPSSTISAQYDCLHDFCQMIKPLYESKFNSVDYKILTSPPTLIERQRNKSAFIVETLMRMTNSIWAQTLTNSAFVGLYRVDGSIQNSPKKNTPPYMWFTSPLRRYVDLVNQSLLLSFLQDEKKKLWISKKEAQAFNQQYTKVRYFQTLMHKQWCLKALEHKNEPILVINDNELLHCPQYPGIHFNLTGDKPTTSSFMAEVKSVDYLTQRALLSVR